MLFKNLLAFWWLKMNIHKSASFTKSSIKSLLLFLYFSSFSSSSSSSFSSSTSSSSFLFSSSFNYSSSSSSLPAFLPVCMYLPSLVYFQHSHQPQFKLTSICILTNARLSSILENYSFFELMIQLEF